MPRILLRCKWPFGPFAFSKLTGWLKPVRRRPDDSWSCAETERELDATSTQRHRHEVGARFTRVAAEQ